MARRVLTEVSNISERAVAEIWKRQMLAKPLWTNYAQQLDVIYPGRHCCDHGPDFRDALLAFDGQLRHGDVEVHVDDSDWYAHRHHLDPAYDNVILHVVMRSTNAASPVSSAGAVLPVLCVDEYLLHHGRELATLLALPHNSPPFCTAKREPAETLFLLEMAGEQRLRAKATVIEGELCLDDAEEVLYRRIMIALGYIHNTAPFGELAEIVPFALLRAIALSVKPIDRPLHLTAFLLGKAGLLANHHKIPSALSPGVQSPEATGAFRAEAERAWNEWRWLDDGSRVTKSWCFNRIRPYNLPAQRLICAGHLFSSLVDVDLAELFLKTLQGSAASECGRLLENALMIRGLLGRARAGEIIVNAILPFALAYSEIKGDSTLAEQALAIFCSYRHPSENEIARYTAQTIFGLQTGIRLNTARQQQGLLHFYRSWCREKRCCDCPLGQANSL